MDPASKKLGPESYLSLPVDQLREDFSVQLFVQRTGGAGAFAVPAEFSFSGASAAAAVATQVQRLQYIREQHERFHHHAASSKGGTVHPCVWSQGEFTYECGKPNQCSITTTHAWQVARVVPHTHVAISILADHGTAADLDSLSSAPNDHCCAIHPRGG